MYLSEEVVTVLSGNITFRDNYHFGVDSTGAAMYLSKVNMTFGVNSTVSFIGNSLPNGLGGSVYALLPSFITALDFARVSFTSNEAFNGAAIYGGGGGPTDEIVLTANTGAEFIFDSNRGTEYLDGSYGG